MKPLIFFLPPKCPSDNALPCPNNTDVSALNNDAGNKQIHQEESLSINLNITPSKKSTSRRDTPVVYSALRRSTRLKEVSNGFKPNSCSSKKCLACSPNPPSIPIHSIQTIATKICDLKQDEVSEEVLLKKRRQAIPIAPKRGNNASGSQIQGVNVANGDQKPGKYQVEE